MPPGLAALLKFSGSGTHFSIHPFSFWASHHQPERGMSLGKKNGKGMQTLTLMHLGDDGEHLVFPSEKGNLYLAHGGGRREMEGNQLKWNDLNVQIHQWPPGWVRQEHNTKDTGGLHWSSFPKQHKKKTNKKKAPHQFYCTITKYQSNLPRVSETGALS